MSMSKRYPSSMKSIPKAKNIAKRKEFYIPSDLTLVQKTSADVLAFLKPAGLSEGQAFDIRLCLEEALINAMKYGNKLKEEIAVRLEVEYDEDEIRIQVEDQGEGFKLKNLALCTEDNNLLKNSGRGIYLIHQLMDRVSYSAKGNSLLMIKFLKNTSSTSG